MHTELKHQLRDKQDEKRELQHVANFVSCPSCNHSNEILSKFCEECGTQIARNICLRCNAQLEENDLFCGECGTPQRAHIMPERDLLSVQPPDPTECSVTPIPEKHVSDFSKVRETITTSHTRTEKPVNQEQKTYNFVSPEVMSKSEAMLKVFKKVKQHTISELPNDERIINFRGSSSDLYFSLEYELIGNASAFVTCIVSYKGKEIPARDLNFTGDICKTVKPGKHRFAWDMRRHPDVLALIPSNINDTFFNFALNAEDA